MKISAENYKKLCNFLKTEFDKKKEKNASYSLRSFSRDLTIPATQISRLFRLDPSFSEKHIRTLMGKYPELKNLVQHEGDQYNLYLSSTDKEIIDQLSDPMTTFLAVLIQNNPGMNSSSLQDKLKTLFIKTDQLDQKLQALEKLGLISIQDNEKRGATYFDAKTAKNFVFDGPQKEKLFQKLHENLLKNSLQILPKKKVSDRVFHFSIAEYEPKKITSFTRKTLKDFVEALETLKSTKKTGAKDKKYALACYTILPLE